jgi:fatty-acyl-CoA synthase
MATALSYLHGASQVPLLGETIGENLDRTVARFGDRDAVISVHQGVRMTYAEFHAAVTEVARGLLALGVEPGERVGIWSPNNAEWVMLQYATAKVGAILVNINPAYRTFELEYALQQSGVSILVLAPRFRQADYLAMLDEVAGRLPALRQRIVLGPETPPGALGWDDLREAAAGASVDQLREREALLQFDDPINIQYTSGTTGFPKGATLSHHNILNNGFFIGEGCGYTEADRVCIPVPLYHCFGMVLGNLACTTHGAAMVYPAESFEPAATLAAVQGERCTSLYGVQRRLSNTLAIANQAGGSPPIVLHCRTVTANSRTSLKNALLGQEHSCPWGAHDA